MAKWGYLARAYAIKEYAYMRSIQHENDPTAEGFNSYEEMDAEFNKLPNVIEDIENILEMAKDNLDNDGEYQYNYRTIKQCEKFLSDFGNQ